MFKLFMLASSFSGLMAVVLGAFGAHGLRSRVSETLLSAFQTGVQYQFYHTLALLAVAVLMLRFPQVRLFGWSGGFFMAGIVLFSGSLYALALGGPRWLGPITPLGGVCFMLGWILFFMAALKMTSEAGA